MSNSNIIAILFNLAMYQGCGYSDDVMMMSLH